MTVSQAILASINGATGGGGGGGGGGGTKSASWSGIDYETISEGQSNTFYVNYTSWDNSLIYYTIYGVGTNPAGYDDFDYDYGSSNPGSGDGSVSFTVNITADASRGEGDQTYNIKIGTIDGGNDIADVGPFTIRDTSQDPQLVMSLDPVPFTDGWQDVSGTGNRALLHNTTLSADFVVDNLITSPNNFSVAPWTPPNPETIISTTELAPDGSYTATKLQPTLADGFAAIGSNIAFQPGVTYTLSCYAKSTYNNNQLYLNQGGASSLSVFQLNGSGTYSYYNNATGTTIAPAANGFYRISMTFVASIYNGIGIYGGFAYHPSDSMTIWGVSVTTGAGSADSIVFDGTTSYADVPTLGTDWHYPILTCSIWFKEDINATPATRTLIAKELVFKLRITSDGFINIMSDIGGNGAWDTSVTSNGSEHLRHGQWNNLTFTVTDQDAGYVYLNGIEFMSFSGGLLGSNAKAFMIGAYDDAGTPNDFFQGNIAQVKMWNYVKTPQQIWDAFVADVDQYIPQAPAFDLTWDVNTNTFADASGILVNINSNTSSVDQSLGNTANGLVWPGTSGDYIDILGVNYVQENFTISIVAKFNISGDHYCPLFDGSALDRIGTGVWANVWGNTLSVGTQDENYGFYDTSTLSSNDIAWWDFVFTADTIAVYKNGLPTAATQVTSHTKKVWYDNLRIGAEYNQTGNNMAGTFYRFKYQKTALTSDYIILQYNANCDMYGLTPIPLSLQFNGSSDYLEVAGVSGDWALGNNYTIEWWEKPNTYDWGTIMSASDNTADVHNTIDILTYNYNAYPNRQGWGAGQIPPGVWGHFAVVVTDASIYKMFVNGVQVYTNNFPSYDLTDTYPQLRIGRSVRDYPSWYNGRMTGIRISDKALYTTNFVPDIIPQLAGETKLLINANSGFADVSDYNYNDAIISTTSTETGGITYLKFAKNTYGQAYDPSGFFVNFTYGVNVGDGINDWLDLGNQSTVAAPVFDDGTYIVVPVYTAWYESTTDGGTTAVQIIREPRPISCTGVSVSTDVPQSFTGWPSGNIGGSRGYIHWNYGDPNLTEFQNIPIGAGITSNITGFGIRSVTNKANGPGGLVLYYSDAGLSGTNEETDRFNFYW